MTSFVFKRKRCVLLSLSRRACYSVIRGSWFKNCRPWLLVQVWNNYCQIHNLNEKSRMKIGSHQKLRSSVVRSIYHSSKFFFNMRLLQVHLNIVKQLLSLHIKYVEAWAMKYSWTFVGKYSSSLTSAQICSSLGSSIRTWIYMAFTIHSVTGLRWCYLIINSLWWGIERIRFFRNVLLSLT